MKTWIVLTLVVVVAAAIGVAWFVVSEPAAPEAPKLTLVPTPELVPTLPPVPKPAPKPVTGPRTHVSKEDADRGTCLACHPSAEAAAIKTAKVGELCVGCHEEPHVDKSHLTEVPLPLGMTTWLPLAPDGYMICTTCHDPHGQSERLMRGGGSVGDVCRSCHVGY